MFCKNCGKEIAEGTVFCPECGTELSDKPNTTGTGQTSEPESKAMGIIAYLFGWIGLIIAVCAGNREDEFTKFHINQALMLDICSLIVFIPVIGQILWVVLLVFRIIGLIWAISGKMNSLPIVGNVKLIK